MLSPRPNNLPAVLAASVPPNTVAEPATEYGDECLELALKLDKAIRLKAPAGWKGDTAREAQVLNAIFPIMKKNKAATTAIFEIIKNQPAFVGILMDGLGCCWNAKCELYSVNRIARFAPLVMREK